MRWKGALQLLKSQGQPFPVFEQGLSAIRTTGVNNFFTHWMREKGKGLRW